MMPLTSARSNLEPLLDHLASGFDSDQRYMTSNHKRTESLTIHKAALNSMERIK